MIVIHATDADYPEVLAKAAADGKPVLVDFWATWCGPCRQVSPVLDAIASERPDVTVVKVDIDQAPATAAAHNVMSVPTLLVIDKTGTLISEFRGPKPKPVLLDALASAS